MPPARQWETPYSYCARMTRAAGSMSMLHTFDVVFSKRPSAALLHWGLVGASSLRVRSPGVLAAFGHCFSPQTALARALGGSDVGKACGANVRKRPKARGRLRLTELRFCKECAIQCERNVGSSSWNGALQVPGVVLCPFHRAPLFRVAIDYLSVRGRGLLPHEVPGEACSTVASLSSEDEGTCDAIHRLLEVGVPYNASQIRSAILAELGCSNGSEESSPQARLRQASKAFLSNTIAGRELGADELAEECALVSRVVLGDQSGHWYWKVVGLLSVFGSIDRVTRSLEAQAASFSATGAAELLTYRLESNVCDLHFVVGLHREALVRAIGEPGCTASHLVKMYPESVLVLRLLDEPWLTRFLWRASFGRLSEDIQNEKLIDEAAAVYLRCIRFDSSSRDEKLQLDVLAGPNHSRKRLDSESHCGIAIANALALRLVSPAPHRTAVADPFCRSANDSAASAAA